MRVLLFKSLSRMTAFVMICLLMAGCAAEELPPAKGKSIAAKSPAAGSRNQSPEKESPPSLQEPPPTRVAKPAEPVEEPEAQRAPPASALPVRFAGLQEALEGTPLDEERIKAHGIRQLSGKHLTLYTDLPRHPAIEELPTVFDLAIPQWAGYFQVPAEKVADWHIIGRLMKDKTRFQKAGLLPG
ncbi:MAG TPA: hypothetical protein EYN70_08100, partial [Planctomycetaceae bacterium]|nr:hypothetical protein [Planctomycetaceae bacterium]